MGYRIRDGYGDRHPGTQELLSFFDTSHLSSEFLKEISNGFADAAYKLVDLLPDSPEMTAGLRKLMEAKDCFVRAGVKEAQQRGYK